MSGSESRLSRAGFFSSAASFSLPLGLHFSPAEVVGYPIDFRVKAKVPQWPGGVEGGHLFVDRIQWGLGCYERFLETKDEVWLDPVLECAVKLVSEQAGGSGYWFHSEPLAHTWKLAPPWPSAMAQGEAVSLLIRASKHASEDSFLSAAERAVAALLRPSEDGGLNARLGEGRFPQEYPTVPASHVLNGGLFALWGVHELAVATMDARLSSEFEATASNLAAELSRWDTGYWSRYSLFEGHPVGNVASSFYHDLHINQLRATWAMTGDARFLDMADRFRGYQDASISKVRAFISKAAFRLLVPRNSLLAFRMPWTKRTVSQSEFEGM